jgi:hypothetical protein
LTKIAQVVQQGHELKIEEFEEILEGIVTASKVE